MHLGHGISHPVVVVVAVVAVVVVVLVVVVVVASVAVVVVVVVVVVKVERILSEISKNICKNARLGRSSCFVPVFLLIGALHCMNDVS